MPEYSDAHYASLENALKTVEGFESISNAPGISQLTTAFMGGNAVSVFLDKVTAFLCASINVHVVRNMLKAEETSVKVKKDDEETAF